jgi:T-complex protein 1 subunit eta
MHAYAKALEIIPRCLAENGGLQVNDVLNQLRRIHAQETDGQYWGVNVFDDVNSVQNTYKNFVWEPLLVKSNYLKAANELACMILSIDETIKAP